MEKHFCNILNANTCDSNLINKIMAKHENIQHTDDMTVSGVDISHLISQLKCGKLLGQMICVLNISSLPTINCIVCYLHGCASLYVLLSYLL